jgi:hypothetical protein
VVVQGREQFSRTSMESDGGVEFGFGSVQLHGGNLLWVVLDWFFSDMELDYEGRFGRRCGDAWPGRTLP